jgi:hypothetical protein
MAAATRIKAASAKVEEVPWPGARATRPVAVRTAPKPTAGSSQVHSLLPARERIARPTSSETAQISTAEA